MYLGDGVQLTTFQCIGIVACRPSRGFAAGKGKLLGEAFFADWNLASIDPAELEV